MPTLAFKNSDGSAQERSWSGQLTVGAAASNDLQLPGLSERHARLTETVAGVELEDLGSERGVFVDGQRIKGKTVLKSAGSFLLGNQKLTLQETPSAPSETAGGARTTRMVPRTRPAPGPRSQTSSGGPAPGRSGGGFTLVGIDGATGGQRFPLKGKVSIGRVAGVDIVVEDDSISRRHAELEKVGEELVVRDLGSANGTLVNGQRVSGERPVRPGDTLSFGVVDFRLDGPSSGLARPRPRDVPARVPGGGAAGDSARPPRRTALYVVGGLLGVLLFAGALKMVYSPPVRPADDGLGLAGSGQSEATVEQLLVRCRGYADAEGQQEPNWTQALKFCQAARDKDPINAEVSEMLRRIDRELKNKGIFEKGKKDLERDRAEEAMDAFKKLPNNSWYFMRARASLDLVRRDLTRRLSVDCRKYVDGNLFAQAIPHCQQYMELVCQDMPEESVTPPVGAHIDLGHGPVKKGDWRPSDPAYADFLRAREKLNPQEVLWACPRVDMFKSGLGVTEQDQALEAALKARYPATQLRHAVQLYWQGKQSEAEAVLFHVRDDIALAPLHDQAESLRKDVDAEARFYNDGQSMLQDHDPEAAVDPFKEALELDERVMGKDTIVANPSYFRANMLRDMAHYAYLKGKDDADRSNKRMACKRWKLGWSFYKGDPELPRAIQACTTWAGQELVKGTCEAADDAIAMAVDGDGYEKKAVALKAQQRCP